MQLFILICQITLMDSRSQYYFKRPPLQNPALQLPQRYHEIYKPSITIPHKHRRRVAASDSSSRLSENSHISYNMRRFDARTCACSCNDCKYTVSTCCKSMCQLCPRPQPSTTQPQQNPQPQSTPQPQPQKYNMMVVPYKIPVLFFDVDETPSCQVSTTPINKPAGKITKQTTDQTTKYQTTTAAPKISSKKNKKSTENPPQFTDETQKPNFNYKITVSTAKTPKSTDKTQGFTNKFPKSTDGTQNPTHESIKSTEEPPEHTDEPPKHTENPPKSTDKTSKFTEEPSGPIDESPEATDKTPEPTDETSKPTDKTPEPTDGGGTSKYTEETTKKLQKTRSTVPLRPWTEPFEMPEPLKWNDNATISEELIQLSNYKKERERYSKKPVTFVNTVTDIKSSSEYYDYPELIKRKQNNTRCDRFANCYNIDWNTSPNIQRRLGRTSVIPFLRLRPTVSNPSNLNRKRFNKLKTHRYKYLKNKNITQKLMQDIENKLVQVSNNLLI